MRGCVRGSVDPLNEKMAVPITRMRLPLTLSLMLTAAQAAALLHPNSLLLGDAFARGNFGSVHWAQVGPHLCVAKCATPGDERAAEYLQVEETINALLWERGDGMTESSDPWQSALGDVIRRINIL